MEEGRSAFKILTGKPTGKRPLGRPRRRWENNIRRDLEELVLAAIRKMCNDNGRIKENYALTLEIMLNALISCK